MFFLSVSIMFTDFLILSQLYLDNYIFFWRIYLIFIIASTYNAQKYSVWRLNHGFWGVILSPIAPIWIFADNLLKNHGEFDIVMEPFYYQSLIQFIPLTLLHTLAYFMHYATNNDNHWIYNPIFLISVLVTLVDILVKSCKLRQWNLENKQ